MRSSRRTALAFLGCLVALPLTAAAHDTYRQALEAGLGEKSFLATFQALETAAQVEVPVRQLDRGRDRL